MKRIEFIAPVESMRGSFSPKQTLLYAENNNPAYEAPVGRQYARNYAPVFVGAKRAATGLKYFAAKTKSATLISTATKMNMALTGGIGAIYAAILAAPTMRARLEYAWRNYFKSPKTFRAFLDPYLRDMLSRKARLIQIGRDVEGDVITVGNPWNASATASYIPEISQEVLVKFWLQLGAIDGGAAPIYFTVDGLKGIAFEGSTFNSIIDKERLNVLNFGKSDVSSGNDYIYMYEDGIFVLHGTVYQEMQSDIITDGKYVTTEVAPE